MILNLSDPFLIRQAQEMHIEEAEPLYWVLEDALFSNKTDRAKDIHRLLAYLAKYNKAALARGLHRCQRDRLKQITHELYSPSYMKPIQSITLKPAISSKLIPFQQEKQLNTYLLEHVEVLSRALNETVKIVGSEIEVDFEYRCDLAAESATKFYPIELKICQSSHQVVSQINKYCWFFYRKLRYDRYRDIQGVVICNGMDSWTVNELRREGHWCFVIEPDNGDNITLRRVS